MTEVIGWFFAVVLVLVVARVAYCWYYSGIERE